MLSAGWEIWGPNGGYLASVAMRAAGIDCGRGRPASINAHFVGAGQTGNVDIVVETNRATRVATSTTVRLSQAGRPWLVATIWGVDDDLDGLEHHTSEVPASMPDPLSLTSTRELLAEKDFGRHPFWHNLEKRPLAWFEWEDRPAMEPKAQSWYRFVPTETFADPWIDAMRSLILIDLDSWPAATLAHTGELAHYAPTIELSARFMHDASNDKWLFSEAFTPVSTGGLMAATGSIWSKDKRLIAAGGSTLLNRPATRRPDK